MNRLAVPLLLVLSIVAASSSVILADTGTGSASTGAVLAEATKAKGLTDPPPLAVVGILRDGLSGSCSLLAKNGGEPRKGVKGSFQAVLIDGNTGTQLANLGRKKGRTNKDGVLSVQYPVPRIGDFSVQTAMVVELNLSGGKKVTEYEFACDLVDETP